MSKTSLYPKEVTLNNCDKEPIHLINAIQNHGFMLVCDPKTFSVIGFSETLTDLLNVKNILDNHLKMILPESIFETLFKKISTKSSGFIEASIGSKDFIFIFHHNEKDLIIEIEPKGDQTDAFQEQAQLATIFSELGDVESDQEMCDVAAILIKRFLGYDRVMIYKFDEYWNGQVISECKEKHLEPWLGLNYPATDIPKQARALFLRQGTRIVADVDSKSSKLVSHNGEPFDLSMSELRSVSPIHIEYLQNMKVGATLAASIIYEGKLWGLIVGHHYSPRFINYFKRQSCRFLTQVFSTQLGLRTSNEVLKRVNKSNLIRAKLIEQMSGHWDLDQGLNKGKYSILDLTEAEGAAAYIDGVMTTYGETPTRKEIFNLIEFVKTHHDENHFVTDNLSSVYKNSEAYTNVASGVMCFFISNTTNSALLWFKPEKSKSVTWAGKFDKNETYTTAKSLTPRKSFEKWSEEQKGFSKPWLPHEIATAKAMRDHIAEVILTKYEEIQKLNEQLQEAYKELESFSYSVSHDLRAPLRGIDGFAQIIKADYYDSLDDFGKSAIETIISSADKMNTLIDDILSFSGLGKKQTSISKFDMHQLVDETLSYLQVTSLYPNTSVKIDENLGIETGDKSMIFQLLVNLIGNAFKYSSKQEQPEIEIGKNSNTYFVKDNGIGFDTKHKDKIFGVFNRLVKDDYEGSGIGLALAHRIIQKHDGEIWVESAPDKGATFFFKLNI